MTKDYDNSFISSIFRMRNIYRWSLMYNTYNENLSQHTCECAFVTHFLAVIGNMFYNRKYSIERLTVFSLFHDITEVLIGDIPTPIKYYNSDTISTFKNLEEKASNELLEQVPKEMRVVYSNYIKQETLSDDEKTLLKVADKLCAYIKCVREVEAGNKDFIEISTSLYVELKAMKSVEADYFLEKCISTF